MPQWLGTGRGLGLLTNGSGRAGNDTNLGAGCRSGLPADESADHRSARAGTDRTTPLSRGVAGQRQESQRSHSKNLEPGHRSFSCVAFFPGAVESGTAPGSPGCRPPGLPSTQAPSTSETCGRGSPQEAGAFTRNRNSFRSPQLARLLTCSQQGSLEHILIRLARGPPGASLRQSVRIISNANRTQCNKNLCGILGFAERSTREDGHLAVAERVPMALCDMTVGSGPSQVGLYFRL